MSLPLGVPPQWSDDAALTEGVLTRRLLAFLVDGFLLTVICGVLWVVLGLFGVLTLGLGLPLLGLVPVVPFLYNWLSLLGRNTATPGQALLGLRVLRDADFGPPDGTQALVWSLGFAVTVALGAVWFLVALVTTRNRTLHDLAAGLLVVRRQALTGPAASWNTGRGGPAFE